MIPVSFTYKGKEYVGQFKAVAGAAARTWYLLIDNFYRGTLMINVREEFVFTSQTGDFVELTSYFESVIIAYYQ